MNTRSKSTLFLIEQLIVIAVFAICAAACISILASAYFTSEDTRDMSNALLVAESAAEAYKATGGELADVARIMGGTLDYADGAYGLIVHYDGNWRASTESGASYRLMLTPQDGDGIHSSLNSVNLIVSKQTGEEIISFPVFTRDKGR